MKETMIIIQDFIAILTHLRRVRLTIIQSLIVTQAAAESK